MIMMLLFNDYVITTNITINKIKLSKTPCYRLSSPIHFLILVSYFDIVLYSDIILVRNAMILFFFVRLVYYIIHQFINQGPLPLYRLWLEILLLILIRRAG